MSLTLEAVKIVSLQRLCSITNLIAPIISLPDCVIPNTPPPHLQSKRNANFLSFQPRASPNITPGDGRTDGRRGESSVMGGAGVYQGGGTKGLKNCNSSKYVGRRRAALYERGCRYRLWGHRVSEAGEEKLNENGI